MSDKLKAVKKRLEIAKSRAIFFRETITSYYPTLLVLAGMVFLVFQRMLTPFDVMDLIFIAVYSAASTFQIHVLYSPERYIGSLDSMENDSMETYMRRHILFAMPTLLIVLPALLLYVNGKTGLVAVAALGFVTLTNIILIIKKSLQRNMGKAQWVEF